MTTKLRNILLLVLVLCLVFVGGGYAAYKGYRHVRQNRLLTKAQGYLAKSKNRQAYFCLQNVLRADPKNVQACRLMGNLAESEGSPAVLMWRSRVVELAPKSTDDRLALARTAIALRDATTATNALEGVSEPGKKTAPFHNVAGTVAVALNRTASAETHFIEAARLDPTNPVPRLNLAVVRLQSTNSQSLAEARTSLNALRADPLVRCQAIRELLGDALRSARTNDALALCSELARQTNSTFQDQILRLGVLQATRSRDFSAALATVRRHAGTNLVDIVQLSASQMARLGPAEILSWLGSLPLSQLSGWQMARLGPAENLSWLRSLPVSVQTNQPAALATAEAQLVLKDWRNLQTSLARQNWGELELIRHAFLARAMRGQELAESAKAEWELAVKGAGGRKDSLVWLMRLADQWVQAAREHKDVAGQSAWTAEIENILWTLVNQHGGDKLAVQALSQLLYAGGRTRGLMTLYNQESRRAPSDLPLKNNLAMTALLLDAQELKPHELAREVYEKAPTNSSYASTYAFSLYLQKKHSEALKVMQKLNPKDLENPAVAPYYGLVLKSNGDPEKAKAYFNWAGKAPMLPEEQKLFEKARVGT